MNNLDQDMFLGLRSQLAAIRDENHRLRSLIERIAAANADFLAEMAAENQRLQAALEALSLPAQTGDEHGR
jgi:hypothetical protein